MALFCCHGTCLCSTKEYSKNKKVNNLCRESNLAVKFLNKTWYRNYSWHLIIMIFMAPHNYDIRDCWFISLIILIFFFQSRLNRQAKQSQFQHFLAKILKKSKRKNSPNLTNKLERWELCLNCIKYRNFT